MSWRKKNTERKERETVLLWMFCFYHGVTSYFWLTVACLTIRLILKIWFIVRLKKTSPPCYYINCFELFLFSLNILFKVNSDRGESVWIGKLFPAQLVIHLDQSLMFVLFHLRNQVFQPYISMQSDVGFRPNWIKHKISLRRIKR